jgi:NitT/TauT family transport system substrate-binding protein
MKSKKSFFDPEHNFLSRRDFVRLSSGVFAGSLLANSCTNSKPEPMISTTKKEDPVLKIGYLPITDATPLLIGHAKGFFEEEGIRVEKPVLIRGWSLLSEAFLSGNFNLVHLLMPIPIYMRFAENHPVKVVAWDHMNGSAITTGLASGIKSLEDFGGKQIAVPYWYSIHNLILQMCMRELNIDVVIQDRSLPLKSNQTNLFVMKPPDMPSAMASGAIDGYVVAEPFNAVGEVLAKGQITRFTGDIFRNHPCCVAVMNEYTINDHPEWSQKLLNAFVKAQKWVVDNKEETALILSKDGKGYLPFPEPIIKRAIMKYDLESYGLKTGTGAIRHPEWGVPRLGFQPYPFKSATHEVVNLLKKSKVEGDASFLKNLDPEQVAVELFEFEMVRKAADKLGGLKVFDGIEEENPKLRTELIEM